jgi:molecular chaperone DnaK (HSP70)
MLNQNNSKMDSMSNLTITDRKLVVGIDFGTTFSGAAWAETRRVSELREKSTRRNFNTKVDSLIFSH